MVPLLHFVCISLTLRIKEKQLSISSVVSNDCFYVGIFLSNLCECSIFGTRAVFSMFACHIFPQALSLQNHRHNHWDTAQILALLLHMTNPLVLACLQRSRGRDVSILRVKLLWRGSTFPFIGALTMVLLWRTWLPSYTHPQLQPRPHSSPFGLSPHN